MARLSLESWMAVKSLTDVLDTLEAAGGTVRFVGGIVRALVMNREDEAVPGDIDLATDLVPSVVTESLENSGIKVIPTGLSHGTVTAVSGGVGYEITTLRRDVSTDGRRATVTFTTDWREDAARRDFTINALSMDRSGQLYDYFGGLSDAQAGIVRFVGEPSRRIEEDYLRVFRFFRFLARFGRVSPDRSTLGAIEAAHGKLKTLSAERVWTELRKLLSANDPVLALSTMMDTRCFEYWLPEAGREGISRVRNFQPHDPVARLSLVAGLAVSGDQPGALEIAQRLKLSNSDRRSLMLAAEPPIRPGLTELEVARALHHLGRSLAQKVALLGLAVDAGAWQALLEKSRAWEDPKFPLSGADVTALGVAPGPEVGRLLDATLNWWLALGCAPERVECLEELARMLNDRRPE